MLFNLEFILSLHRHGSFANLLQKGPLLSGIACVCVLLIKIIKFFTCLYVVLYGICMCECVCYHQDYKFLSVWILLKLEFILSVARDGFFAHLLQEGSISGLCVCVCYMRVYVCYCYMLFMKIINF